MPVHGSGVIFPFLFFPPNIYMHSYTHENTLTHTHTLVNEFGGDIRLFTPNSLFFAPPSHYHSNTHLHSPFDNLTHPHALAYTRTHPLTITFLLTCQLLHSHTPTLAHSHSYSNTAIYTLTLTHLWENPKSTPPFLSQHNCFDAP